MIITLLLKWWYQNRKINIFNKDFKKDVYANENDDYKNENAYNANNNAYNANNNVSYYANDDNVATYNA